MNQARQPPPRVALWAVTLAVFLVWSNSFIVISHLLGEEMLAPAFDALSLTVARCTLIVPVCWVYCLMFRAREVKRIVAAHPVRVVVASLLAAPAYNLALFQGQAHGVPPVVASVTTALAPLLVLLLAAAFLEEPLTRRNLSALAMAGAGLAAIALSKHQPAEAWTYGGAVGVTALAPLSFALYTVVSKPVLGRACPTTWAFLTLGIGGLPLVPLLPWSGGPQLTALSTSGWLAIGYLSYLSMLLGYAVWGWLLRALPASSVGFTVFLNPPLTAVSKAALVALFPTLFAWRIGPLEWLGGGLALGGLALALWPARAPSLPPDRCR